jgi:hypothetical protein
MWLAAPGCALCTERSPARAPPTQVLMAPARALSTHAMAMGFCYSMAIGTIGALGAPASSGNASTTTVELFLLPHTHADVGWLETPENLARVNVSRILDGVVGNLANDTKKRRRFVWDEMYFLQWWWEHRATTQQQATFKELVSGLPRCVCACVRACVWGKWGTHSAVARIAHMHR